MGNEIKIQKNGPLMVSGDIQLFDSFGNEYQKEGKLFLCRCGHSNNKPFCDGAHKKAQFDSNPRFSD
jgi:CDGSH iron-sulfur domain-containing protein 3